MTRTLRDPEVALTLSEAGRARLVWAASQLVQAQSYHATGVKAICDLASVQRGSFYHYFQSKEALMLEVLDTMWERFDRDALGFCRDETLTPRGRVDALVDHLHAQHKHHKSETGQVLGCMFGNVGAESSNADAAIRRRVMQFFSDWATALHAPFHEAQALAEIDDASSPAELATMTVAALAGLNLLSKVHNDPEILLVGGRRLTERLWSRSCP